MCVLQVKAEANYSFTKEDSASIILITSGKGQLAEVGQLLSGHVIFIPANETPSMKVEEDITIYRALCMQ